MTYLYLYSFTITQDSKSAYYPLIMNNTYNIINEMKEFKNNLWFDVSIVNKLAWNIRWHGFKNR